MVGGLERWEHMKMYYVYGMRLRGFSPGCQPMSGLVDCKEDPSGRYSDLLIYDRILSDNELKDYELDFLTGEVRDDQN